MIVGIGHNNFLIQSKTKAMRTVELAPATSEITELVPNLHIIQSNLWRIFAANQWAHNIRASATNWSAGCGCNWAGQCTGAALLVQLLVLL
jgi:hypothetical protein